MHPFMRDGETQQLHIDNALLHRAHAQAATIGGQSSILAINRPGGPGFIQFQVLSGLAPARGGVLSDSVAAWHTNEYLPVEMKLWLIQLLR
ncbi:hypothetical protein N7528_000448 [Penicillium herquei]|nr:hypothetical protein N7528_000448 [Penicillium herquei]